MSLDSWIFGFLAFWISGLLAHGSAGYAWHLLVLHFRAFVLAQIDVSYFLGIDVTVILAVFLKTTISHPQISANAHSVSTWLNKCSSHTSSLCVSQIIAPMQAKLDTHYFETDPSKLVHIRMFWTFFRDSFHKNSSIL